LYGVLTLKSVLTTEAVLEAVNSTVPLSVSRREEIARLRDTARGRFTAVG
jgi:hypothetical protein